MPRSLTIRKPTAAEIRQLNQLLEEELRPWQRRRAEAILLYATGMTAMDIAQFLEVHFNTIRADLRAFDQQRLKALRQPRSIGAPSRIDIAQRSEILRLAALPPYELGLPYGRWSATKLRQYLLKRRVVKAISREHLRRVLKKGDSICVESGAKSSAMIRNEARFCVEFA